MIVEVMVPQLGVNEDEVKVAAWHVAEGATVAQGEVLCTLETTKAAYEVEAPHQGVIRIVAAQGEMAPVQAVLAVIGQEAEVKQYALPEEAKGPLATKKAIELAKKLGVDLNAIAKPLIREADVRAIAAEEDVPTPDDLAVSANSVIIWGAGMGGETLLEALVNHSPLCFIDDACTQPYLVQGIPVYHPQVLKQFPEVPLALAIGNGKTRLMLLRSHSFITVIHPTAVISPSATVGAGTFVKAGALIDAHSHIGDGCIIDNGVIIPHHNTIEKGCHLAPGVTLGSNITIGTGTVVGIGTSISTHITIGPGCIIAPGSAVRQNLPPNTVFEGHHITGKTNS